MRSLNDVLGEGPGNGRRPRPGAFGTSIGELYPTVTALLDGSIYGENAKAKCASLLIFAGEGGTVMVRLSERNKGLDLWSSGSTLQDALAALEGGLQSTPVPWRRQQQFGGGKAKP